MNPYQRQIDEREWEAGVVDYILDGGVLF